MRNPRHRSTINILQVLRVVGWLLLIESGFMIAPLITSVVLGEPSVLGLGIALAVTLVSGIVLTFMLPRPHYDMGKRDGFLLTAMVWVVFTLFGMIPFMFAPLHMSVSDAFFETMSGFTTTGATLLESYGDLPSGLLVWRSLIQWIGGMGIIIFTLAVLPMLNYSGGVQMFNAEVTGITHDKLRPRVSQTAKGLWGIYISLTVILFTLLWAGPLNFFESLCQAFSIMSTGGYAPSSMDISLWDSTYVELVSIVFMFLGGMNFSLIFGMIGLHPKSPWRNDVFRAYIYIITVMFVLFVIDIVLTGNATSVKSVTLYPLFQIVSMLSSTGYVIGDYQSWGPFVMSLTLLMMFFGACAGSTSGGAKIDRLLYLIKNVRNELYRGLHPNSVMGVKMNDKVVSIDLVNKVIAFLSLYVVMILLGGVALTAVGLPLFDSFFTSFSCLSNTGLIAGVTGYGETYEIVPSAGKWILSSLMLIGRLEVFTIILIFTPEFWHR